jgi:glutathione peroxidase-family protein
MNKFFSFGIVLALCFGIMSFETPNPKEKNIADFSLKNVDNKFVSLNSYKKAKGFIVVFTCNKCPMAKLYSERLNKLNLKYSSKGFYLLAINSMDTLVYAEESFKKMKARAKTEQFNFPYLQDKLQVVAKAFKAVHTPQAFILLKNNSGKYTIKYEGAIDDNAGDAVTAKPYLSIAVDELLANKPVSNPKTESFGCRIYIRGESDKMK